MTRHIGTGMLMVALSLSTGCFGDLLNEKKDQTVNVPVRLPPASEAASTMAFDVWSELLAANPEIGTVLSPSGDANFRPDILIAGLPSVSLYRRGSLVLYLTEGLVNRCPPEGKDGKYKGKLAAVLASQLGKMVVEAYYQKNMRTVPSSGQVFASQVPGDNSDHTDLAQQAIIDKTASRPQNSSRLMPNQDPKVLARNYLTKANYSPNDLLQVEALVRQAEKNPELEKQVNPPRSSGSFK